MDITYLKSVGPQRAEALNKSDIYSLQDLVTYFPVSYITRELAGNINDIRQSLQLRFDSSFMESESQPAALSSIFYNMRKEFSIVATIVNKHLKPVKNNKQILTIVAKDSNNTTFELVFFSGVSYFASVCVPNALILVSGNPSFNEFSKQVSFTHPDIEFIEEEDIQTYNTGGIIPKYRITEYMRKTGVSNRVLRKIIRNAINIVLNQKQIEKVDNDSTWFAETLPEDIISQKQLCSKKIAVESLHSPQNIAQIDRARYRLKFEEMFWYQLALQANRKAILDSSRGITITSKSKLSRLLYDTLPYKLTSDQKKALRELASDIASGKPMNRLLQGDVGSGKTIVAILGMLMLVDAGYQVAVMCPTEILAEQHYLTITNLINNYKNNTENVYMQQQNQADSSKITLSDLQIELLLGSTRKKLKEEIKSKIQTGEANIVVGTHALLQPDVVFSKLGLIVIDEEHRFGVSHKQGRSNWPDRLAFGGLASRESIENTSSDISLLYKTKFNKGAAIGQISSPANQAVSVENLPRNLGNCSTQEKSKGEPVATAQNNEELHTITSWNPFCQHELSRNQSFPLRHNIAQTQFAASAPNNQGENLAPHVLFMTATPIPRTMTMTLYGDLDVSVIKSMPKNRLPIITHVCFDNQREEIYQFIRNTTTKGRQVYIVYPLVEKSEKLAYKSAVEQYEIISEQLFPEFKCGLLHGQMHYSEKEETMKKFSNNEFNILVSTTVIEVGIDVPNATVMIVEDASRFGLAQLHQLRGRVGRGAEQSYCFLMTKDDYKFKFSSARNDDLEKEKINSIVRLKAMQSTNDGFELSEIDMKLRGPGDILGTKQSGLPDFKYIDLVKDIDIIEDCKVCTLSQIRPFSVDLQDKIY